jgi:hypothetical protein
MGLIWLGWTSFFLSIGVWRFTLFCCCILYLLFGCLFSEMMKYLHIARHLAAKFGTRLAAFSVYVILLWVDDSRLGEVLLFFVFFVICYFHQIVMISVIKLCRVVDLADLHGSNVLAIILGF